MKQLRTQRLQMEEPTISLLMTGYPKKKGRGGTLWFFLRQGHLLVLLILH